MFGHDMPSTRRAWNGHNGHNGHNGFPMPRNKQHLTDAIVRRFPAPAKGKQIFLDDDVVGFGVRITAAGARSFILRYVTRAGRERTFTIGDATVWKTTAARAEAKRLRQVIDQGGDPMADIEAERAAPPMPELIPRFSSEPLPRKKPRTRDDYEMMLRLYIGPHFRSHVKVADVAFSDIDSLHRKITNHGATYQANRCVSVLSAMFSLAIKW